ncbi:MAG TPA: phospholipase D-like domain-containing protein [Jatrophihabitantaceae bacterium]|nr:phospholipase D-like domain-containing protein [Jatrophihabitantaceae bacterium]
MPRKSGSTATHWFLSTAERGNPASEITDWTEDNDVTPLVDGASYFPALHRALCETRRGDQVYLADFRGDTEELLNGPGTSAGEVLADLAERGVLVFGLIWRSQPGWMDQSEGKNAELARNISEAGGEVLLDSRTRRAGSHHQKFVVIRHPGRPDRDVAFMGGIDLGRSRNDGGRHDGDRQAMDFPSAYGSHPPWHDVQAAIRGPAVADIEHTFRERWYGSTVLDLSSPVRMAIDRAYHAGKLVGRDLPEPLPAPEPVGTHAVQVLRTYPARLRRYPFAPLGERSIAHAYRKVLARARRLIYIEDQYLWAPFVADLIADALRSQPDLHVVAVVPRFPDKDGTARWPSLVGREQAVRICRTAGTDRFAIYDLENDSGTPVYVHAKVVVVDDVWAMIGSDNLNRRSWTHDSELSCAVLDERTDERDPPDPAGQGDNARVFARDLRLRLLREHLDRDDDMADLVDPVAAFEALQRSADELQAWHDGGRSGPRPPGRLRPHVPERLPRRHRVWAVPVYRHVYDPDGRALRDRVRHRP